MRDNQSEFVFILIAEEYNPNGKGKHYNFSDKFNEIIDKYK